MTKRAIQDQYTKSDQKQLLEGGEVQNQKTKAPGKQRNKSKLVENKLGGVGEKPRTGACGKMMSGTLRLYDQELKSPGQQGAGQSKIHVSNKIDLVGRHIRSTVIQELSHLGILLNHALV